MDLSSIEKSMTYLEGHADDARKKLETISTDITEAKAAFKTLIWVFIAIGIPVWVLLPAVTLMWAKHLFRW